ncbi:proteinase inhibitor I4 serpin [Candidatus Pacearchaeota archaeon]|nr:proteinase inhibitor I4 serpin [Candidatus Pacearchaeota archaeon]|tara:strand:+ start:6814 stop:7068 length:255 start_codon:yes stop_codon:yes gene_type:complete
MEKSVKIGIGIVIIVIVIIVAVLLFLQYPEENRCKLEPERGSCKALIPKYHFDSDSQTCKEFKWGGCDGVVPFEMLEECKETCE